MGSRFAFAEAKASPGVDVDETPRFVTEVEHEGKSVKEPSFPSVCPESPRLSRLWLHSCLFAGVGSHGALLGFLGTCTASLWKVVAEELTLGECGG